MGDPYVDPSTGVLRNRLGIKDSDELRAAEADISAAALFRLETSSHLGEGHFDFPHLRALHVHIFGEVYQWAGKPRTVEMAKGAWFCLARNIEEFAASVFRELAENYLVGLDRPDLVKGIAATYGQLNALHPFREGNGRTQRAFLTQLGRLGGWRLRWSDLDGDTNDEASRRSLEDGDDSALAEMVDALLEEEPPAVPVDTPRRVVLAIPEVAAAIPGGIGQLRAGPYPAEARCAGCRDHYRLADEPSIVLLQPWRPSGPGVLTFAHARCRRSRVLPPPSARQIRELESRSGGGGPAMGVAMLLVHPPVGAAFAWRAEHNVLGRTPDDDVIDYFLNQGLSQGLLPAANLVPPEGRTPGWSATVEVSSQSLVVTDPEGVPAFVGSDLDLPPGWIKAVETSGDCVIYIASRAELDLAGFEVAARQGRVIAGRAAVIVTR